MSLEYYLYNKKRCDDILKCLEINNEDNFFTSFSHEYGKRFIKKHKCEEEKYNFFKHVIKSKKVCEENIKKLCNHEYVKDLIDITPEKSKMITYCTICEHEK